MDSEHTENPIVDVVVVSYNHVSFIRDALDGLIMQQTTFPWRVLVADDCSADGTQAIILEYARKYPNRIQPFLSPKNIGVAGPEECYAWSIIWKYCSAKYLVLFEGDDYWVDPLKLQKQVDALEADPSLSACATGAWQLRAGVQSPYSDDAILGRRLCVDDLMTRDPIATATLCIRGSCMRPKPKWVRHRGLCDWAWLMYLATKGQILVLPERTAVYRIHPGGLWSQGGRIDGEVLLMRARRIVDAYTLFLKILPRAMHQQVRQYRRGFCLDAADALVRMCRYGLARRYWLMAHWPPSLSGTTPLRLCLRSMMVILTPRLLYGWDRWRREHPAVMPGK